MAAGSLRWWLRKTPQPVRLRIRLPDGDERSIALSGDKDKWRIAEEAILAAGAILVEALDAEGAVLRGRRLEAADEDDLPVDGDTRATDKAIVRDRREQSAMVHEFRVAMVEAFDKGTASAGQSQRELVGLVDILSKYLTAAITSLHQTSMQLAQLSAQSGTDGDGPSPQAAAFLAVLAGRLGVPMPGVVDAAPNNGKTK